MLGRIFNYETSRKFRSFLSKYGISLRFSSNTRPVDFTGQPGIDPITAIYQAGGRPFLLKVPLKDCIFFGHLAFPCTPDSPSPQIQTLIEFDKGNVKTWRESPLVDFYNNFQPKNAAEMMGLEPEDEKVSHKLRQLSPDAAIFPWSNNNPEEQEKVIKKNVTAEAKAHRFSRQAFSSQYRGPANHEKIKMEFQRHIDIYRRIISEGLLIDPEGIDNVEAIILKKEQNYTYFIINGNHRIAAMAALKKNECVLQIRPLGTGGVVNYHDSELWPIIRNNIISKESAKKMFMRFLAKKQPFTYIQQ